MAPGFGDECGDELHCGRDAGWTRRGGPTPRVQRSLSLPEYAEGDHGNAVASAVGVGTGGHDDCVDEVVTDLLAQPVEMADGGVVDALAELGFDGEDAALRLDDDVDLVASAGGAQVVHAGPADCAYARIDKATDGSNRLPSMVPSRR